MFVVPMFVVPGISLCRASLSTVVPGISFDGGAGHLFVGLSLCRTQNGSRQFSDDI